MSKLNGLVSHFVDQVLEAIRVASIEDIMSLTPSQARALEATVRANPSPAPARRGAEPRKKAARSATTAKAPRAAAPISNEITDPEMILAASTSPEPAPTREKRPRRAPTTPPPAAAAAPPQPPPRPTALVRSDETIVRASSAGVVVRRAKKDA